MRTLVLGDVHGGYLALRQVLDRANFDPASDRLIFLGDVCDGWPDVLQSIQLLMEMGAESVWGNHDQWAWYWMLDGQWNIWEYSSWVTQGGEATLNSFKQDNEFAHSIAAPYFNDLKDYIYDEERDMIFVHGGIPLRWGKMYNTVPFYEESLTSREALDRLDRDYLSWDRELWMATIATWKGDENYTRPLEKTENGNLTPFNKVFIGHTTTTRHSGEPIEAAGVVCMDTGGGWEGKLSIMDVDTGEFWQSDKVATLYPEAAGRR